MKDAFIVDAVRTARGKKKGGSLNRTHPVDLAAHPLKAIIERNNVDPLQVDDVIMGCVTQTGEQGVCIGRGAVLAAGLPEEMPGVTLNRFCGSGLQACNFAAQAVMSGAMDLVIGAGVESMTRVAMGTDFGVPSPALVKRFPNMVPQGLSAEMVAERWKLTRQELDEFSAGSQQKAARAIEEGYFKKSIVPIEVEDEDGTKRMFEVDEHVRPGTTVEALAGLLPSFKPDGVIHAGNSSGIVDGSGAVLIASEEKANELGLKPRARFVAMAVAATDPVIMLTAPIPATRKCLKKAGMTIDQIDLIEYNEAFASVPLAGGRDLGMDFEKMNVNGGAIAMGHPVGATGAMLVGTVLDELERREKRYGLVTLCTGFGMGVTTIVERV